MIIKILRRIYYFPFLFRRLWIVEKELNSKNWEKVCLLLKQIQQKGFYSDKISFWMGTALLHLNRNEEALTEFNEIRSSFKRMDFEASRHWNHALALYRTDNKEAAYKLLMEKINPDWPTDTYWKARQFLADAGFEAYKIKV